ncbi:RecQ family ATP-dependent DNA helicase [Mesobacillus jeotgali]|uniref:RecQ family ATP-dependent DNA helicase n=1 Tax=Mesobacillus jeotgali TaxID=129985 RepID=UPI0009A79B04|nr:ATP-dependent DNA helicase RecQ [Mesobacillus jeotgali]
MELKSYLATYFNFTDFRPGQRETIESVLGKKHTISMLPTGTGKSLCYQLPGYLMEGPILVVSPLLSLMQDQVDQMMAMGEKRVIALNSFLSPQQKAQALDNLEKYKYIFISPEMLGIDSVLGRLQKLSVSLYVVDEAHCISQWGYDFRPDYLKLGEYREKLGHPVTLALTATASKEVRRDIAEKLCLEEWNEVVYSVDRPAISLAVEHVSTFQEKVDRTFELVKILKGPGIIYFSSKKVAEQTAGHLREKGIKNVMAYHGGLDSESRILIQQQFINGQLDVVCATSAFGMGINKDNVRYVIHFHMPMQIESYLQEIGRAARDGLDSIAILLYTPGDEQLAHQLAEGEMPDQYQIERLFGILNDNQVSYHDLGKRAEEFSMLCGFTDIQWRIVEEYLSNQTEIDYKADKQSLIQLVENRLLVKKKKIRSMLEWIHTRECKRAVILKQFNEELAQRPENCCSICGINMEQYKETKPFPQHEKNIMDWKRDLASILLIGERIK